jgi:excisionase family DNA binding protein
MADYRQIAGEIAGPGHDDLIKQVARRLHANEPPAPPRRRRPAGAVPVLLAPRRPGRASDGDHGGGPDSYLKPGQVAVRLGVSNRTVYRMIESGELAALRLGRTYQVSAASALAMIDARLAEPGLEGGGRCLTARRPSSSGRRSEALLRG